MNRTSANSQNESTKTLWPRVPKSAGDEFQQSVAVAQLAVQLCEIKMAKSKMPLEKENLDPKKFLEEAWNLIASAREHVLRPQTDIEYLIEQGSPREALAEVFWRRDRERMIPFASLCDPDRNKGDTETIEVLDAETGRTIQVNWKVYCSERGFENLFGAYWRNIGEKWKEADRTKKPIPLHSKDHRTIFTALARKPQVWKERGERMFKSWKQYGVPPADFRALAKFRRAQDNRAANLPERPKRRRVTKSKTRQRNVRAREENSRTQR
jgi:hypothetical protein